MQGMLEFGCTILVGAKSTVVAVCMPQGETLASLWEAVTAEALAAIQLCGVRGVFCMPCVCVCLCFVLCLCVCHFVRARVQRECAAVQAKGHTKAALPAAFGKLTRWGENQGKGACRIVGPFCGHGGGDRRLWLLPTAKRL